MMAKVTDLNGCFVRVGSEEEMLQIEGVIRKSKTRLMMNLKMEDDDIYGKISFLAERANKHRFYKEVYFHGGEFFDAPVTVVDIEPVPMAFDIVSEPVKVSAELAQIPWTDGSIDEQESSKIKYEDGMRKAMQNIARTCGKSFAVDIGYQDLPALVEKLMYENKDNSEWSNGDDCIWSGTKATFIGYSKSHGSRCAIEFLRGNCSVIETVFIEDISKPETESEKKTRELAEEVNRICFDLFGTPAFDCNQDIIDTVEKFVINGYRKVD